MAGTKRGRRASVESSAAPGEVGGTGGRKGKKAKKDVALSIDPTIRQSALSLPSVIYLAKLTIHPFHRL